MKNKKIHYTHPSITDLEIKYVNDAITNGWGEKCYEYITKLEDLFKDYLGVKHAIATSSCTGALHMGLNALNISSGDEIIVADINWVATVAPIFHLGATPVYVDILKDSWCIDPNKVRAAINSKTKAIIAVHLYGNLCNMNELLEISKQYNIPLIEDSAEAIGSIYDGKRAGSIGKFGTFSFHGTKTITTGEGGMFVTNDDDLYRHVMTLSNHGRAIGEPKQFWPAMIGFKYKMSNLQAALGCAQLERISSLVNCKRDIFQSYYRNLKDLPITMNPEPDNCTNGFWMPTVVFRDLHVDRDLLIEKFKKKNIDARVFFWPLSSMKLGGKKAEKILPVAENIYNKGINLPSSYEMDNNDIQIVSNIIRSFLNK